MNFNIFLSKSSFLNTPPPFNGARFEIWKARSRILIQSISFELWETIINNPFIHTHRVNGEVVDKFNSL